MKRVFLTGASSGIGRAIAQALLARGDEVWGTSRNLERLPKMPQFHPVRLDLGDPRSIDEAFNGALADAGHFDVLINNAGSGHFGPAEFLSRETIAIQFQILVFAQVRLMQLALRSMQTFGEGLIINVTSLAGRLPVPFMAAYNAAKAGKTWETAERNMRNAPKPVLVARHVLKLIEDADPPPRITVGDAFQTKIAPLIFRFLPQRVRVWGLRRYYGI